MDESAERGDGDRLPVMPGFREMALRRAADEQAARMAEDRGRLVRELAEQRQAAARSPGSSGGRGKEPTDDRASSPNHMEARAARGRSRRMTVHARLPGQPPEFPSWPGTPHFPGWPPAPPSPAPGPVPPTRVWLDPQGGWQTRLLERLLERRIVLASGLLR